MSFAIRDCIASLPMSATLAANQAAAQRRAQGKRVLHMGFGQSPFPVHPLLAEALGENAGSNLYEHVAGVGALRDAARDYFAAAFAFDADDYDVIVAPGSKLILYALQMAIDGDVVLPVPSWVSYEPQAAMLGDRVIPIAATLSDEGYRIDPDKLSATLAQARRDGANPTKLIINSPNNPTGLNMNADDRAQLARACAREGLFVISDEIYGLVSFDDPHRSIAGEYAETAVTTGLSKHLSLGGWRIGFGFIPRRVAGLFDAICAIASETWSSVSAPVQRAAIVAVSGDERLEEFIADGTRIHAAVARHVADAIRIASVRCAAPAGAFYLWPDYDSLREPLAAAGITDSAALANRLLESYDVLALPGTGFGAQPADLCLRLSVCDYDGAQALESLRRAAAGPPAIADFAPRVAEAATALQAFARDHQR